MENTKQPQAFHFETSIIGDETEMVDDNTKTKLIGDNESILNYGIVIVGDIKDQVILMENGEHPTYNKVCDKNQMAYICEGESEPNICLISNDDTLSTDINEGAQLKNNSVENIVLGSYKDIDKAGSSDTLKQLEKESKKQKRSIKNRKRYLCVICNKSYNSQYFKTKHAKEVHGNTNKNQKDVSDKLNCNHCDKRFDDVHILTEHRRNVHKMQRGPYQSYLVHLKCLECELNFTTKNEFRNHLEDKHNLDMKPINLKFSTIEAFLAWKSKIERETLTIFHRRMIRGKSDGSAMKYECFRTGRNYFDKHKTPVQQMNRQKGNKLGVVCSAGIYMEKKPEGVFVTYYPIHYGHGNEMRIAELSSEEQAAVDELTSKGMSFEKLLNDLKGADYMDINHIYPIKKRFFSWVKNAYESEEYDSGLSDAECLSQWLQKCCQLEEVPILLFKQQDVGFKSEKFILVIMTEFQKHIFLSSSKEIICVDTHNRATDPHLIVVSVMDELNTAFPVAYCITNKLNKQVMIEFFTCIKESIGNLSPKYLVTSYYTYIYESWIAVMGYNPVWIWSRSFLEAVIRANFRFHLKKYPILKCELYNIIQIMLECRSEDVFVLIFKNFISRLENDKRTVKLAKWIMKWLGVNTEKWARCYQQEIDCSTNLHLELLRHMFRACCRTGKKKKLYTLIIVIMKILRNKILDRIFSSFDNTKLDLAMEAISLCHDKGMTIPPNNICSLTDTLWVVGSSGSEKVYVTQDTQKCPDYCSLKCHKCNVCVHQFSCSCVHSIINANLCMHVHAVVFKFLGPLKDPASPANTECYSDSVLDNEDISFPDNESIEIQPEVSIPTSETFTSSQSSSSINQVLNRLQCEINTSQNNIEGEINTSLNNSQCVINTSLDNLPCKTFTTCAPTPLNFNLPSHINVPENSTQSGISFPSSQIVTNVVQQNVSNITSSHFVMEISGSPKILSGVPILNIDPPNLSSGTPDIGVVGNSQLLQTILSQTTEIYQSVTLGNLKEESLTKVMKHLSACQKIIKNDRNFPIEPLNPVSVISKQSNMPGSISCVKKSTKRTSRLLDNDIRNKLQKTDNSITDSPRVLVISNNIANPAPNSLKNL